MMLMDRSRPEVLAAEANDQLPRKVKRLVPSFQEMVHAKSASYG
jgi:hypothetical protein